MRRFAADAYPGLIETSFRCRQGILSFWLISIGKKAIKISILIANPAQSGRE